MRRALASCNNVMRRKKRKKQLIYDQFTSPSFKRFTKENEIIAIMCFRVYDQLYLGKHIIIQQGIS